MIFYNYLINTVLYSVSDSNKILSFPTDKVLRYKLLNFKSMKILGFSGNNIYYHKKAKIENFVEENF